MPTTIAHAIAGYAASEATSSQAQTPLPWWKVVLLAAIVANLPDLDFIPGLIVDNIPKYHRTMTHGVPAALAVATGVTVALRGWWRGSWTSLWLLVFAAYASHLLLDVVTPDPTGGSGLRPLWPFSNVWLAYPLPFLEPLDGIRMLDHGPTNDTFWDMLLSSRAAAVFLVDALIAVPLVFLGKAIRWAIETYGKRAVTLSSSIQ